MWKFEKVYFAEFHLGNVPQITPMMFCKLGSWPIYNHRIVVTNTGQGWLCPMLSYLLTARRQHGHGATGATVRLRP